MWQANRHLSIVLLVPFIQFLPYLHSNYSAVLAERQPTSEFPQAAHDGQLTSVRESDRSSRQSDGKLLRMPPGEHLRRASVYMSNRAFVEAREHWQAFIEYYPEDPRVSEALLGIGRSHFQQRNYNQAYLTYERNARTYPGSKEGRESLNFSAAALLRMNKPSEAVDRYIEYINRYPTGERIESAHLNVIDTLREAGRPDEADDWVKRTRQRFAGTATDTSALFARLRLEVAESRWQEAVATADELRGHQLGKAVNTSATEVAYLRAYSLEKSNKRDAAFSAYLAIPDSVDSYYGWLATERLLKLSESQQRSLINERVTRVKSQIARTSRLYPTHHRFTILRATASRKLDPRFLLALIRQESSFRPQAKSPAGARGLLQLTIDAAQRYAPSAGIHELRENDLYRPETSIILGSEYLADLLKIFQGNLEAVAASYNGGEDNVARWITRARLKDAGVFTAEIGFDETKGYVQKVLTNYRAYRELYNADLTAR